MERPLSQPLAWLVAVVLLLALGAGPYVAVSSLTDEEPTASDRAARPRDGLAICVQVVGTEQQIEATVQTTIDSVVQRLTSHPNWRFNLNVPVDVGCGTTPSLYLEAEPVSFFYLSGRIVSKPSFYRIMVFVVPDDVSAKYGGSRPFPLSTEERSCYADTCRQEAIGMYVTAAQANDREFLTEWISKAIGLEPL